MLHWLIEMKCLTTGSRRFYAYNNVLYMKNVLNCSNKLKKKFDISFEQHTVESEFN